jgi:hypothetical protein
MDVFMKGGTGMLKRIVLISVITVILMPACVFAYDIPTNRSYIYSNDRRATPIPDAYIFTGSIKLSKESGIDLESLSDMCVLDDGSIFVLEGKGGRVFELNPQHKIVRVLTDFYSADGGKTKLSEPEGIHVTNDRIIYIADTKQNRIIKTDIDGRILLEVKKPQNMVGVSDKILFLPSKIDIDDMGRIYVVARNINMGMLCLDSKGAFLNFVGAPRVIPSLFDIFWLRFSTKAQKEQMTQYVSTEYNNVLVDAKNFVWGTIGAIEEEKIQNAIISRDRSGVATPVAKINSIDRDVLKRNGFYAPLGDLNFTKKQSRIVDVGLGTGGIYSLLDYERGRIFSYDSNGNLLYVFGSKGDKKGDFVTPVAIGCYKNQILVLDKDLCEINVFEPTDYGKLVINAVEYQFNGDYDNANRQWAIIAKENANFEYAYIGLGDVSIGEEKFKTAMDYFKYAKDTAKYSEAFTYYRQAVLEKVFPFIFGLMAAFIIFLITGSIYKKVTRYLDS